MAQQDLSELMDRRRKEIAGKWAEMVHRLPDSHYGERPLEELTASTMRAVGAMVEALATHSDAELERYLTDVSLTRLRMGFNITEVIEALLLAKEAALPIIWESYPPGSPEALEGISQLDDCLRRMIGCFGQLYAEAMQQSLREEQRRTALMLEATRTASASLELNEVLRRVTGGLAEAVGVEQCEIYLVDHARGLLMPVEGMAMPQWPPLDPTSDPFLREVLEGRRPAVSSNVETDTQTDSQIVLAPGLKSVLAVPFVVHDRVVAVAIVSAPGQQGHFAQEQVDLAWGIANTVALTIENARLYDETRKRLAESESLQRVTAALLQETSLEEVLEIVCSAAQQLTGAMGSSVFLLQDGDWLRTAFSTGTAAPTFERMPVEGSVTGMAVRRGEAILTNDPTEGYRGDVAPTALLAVPLHVREGVVGALDAVNKPGGFTEEDLRVTSLFADQAAIAIENARLYGQARELAAAQERQRLARDLHDAVTQTLFSASLIAEVLPRLWERSPEEGRRRLEELRQLTRGALAEMRTLLLELRPGALTDVGLGDLLRQLAEAVTGRARLPVALSVESQCSLPPLVQVALYRIAQEALNNIVKHAGASQAHVVVRCDPERVELRITDNGRGFDLEGVSSEHLGLRIMRERADSVGATIAIRSEIERGTHVEVVWRAESREGQ